MEPIKLEDMIGYDPYCAKDFVTSHPNFSLPPKREYGLNHFKRINMAHSL